jgi:hypothetical protein
MVMCFFGLQPVDFDSLPSPFFNLTVYVQDTDATHVDTAYVEIRVTDYNDNPPIFVPNSKKVSIRVRPVRPENVSRLHN